MQSKHFLFYKALYFSCLIFSILTFSHKWKYYLSKYIFKLLEFNLIFATFLLYEKENCLLFLLTEDSSLLLQYNMQATGIPFSRPLRESSLLCNFSSMFSRH